VKTGKERERVVPKTIKTPQEGSSPQPLKFVVIFLCNTDHEEERVNFHDGRSPGTWEGGEPVWHKRIHHGKKTFFS